MKSRLGFIGKGKSQDSPLHPPPFVTNCRRTMRFFLVRNICKCQSQSKNVLADIPSGHIYKTLKKKLFTRKINSKKFFACDKTSLDETVHHNHYGRKTVKKIKIKILIYKKLQVSYKQNCSHKVIAFNMLRFQNQSFIQNLIKILNWNNYFQISQLMTHIMT